MCNGVGVSNEDACVMVSGGGVREPLQFCMHMHMHMRYALIWRRT